MYNVLDRADGSVHRRHIDQMELHSDPVPSTGPVSEGSESSKLPLAQPITQPTPVSIQPTTVTAPTEDNATAEEATPGDTTSVLLRRSSRMKKPSVRYEDFV